MIKNLKAADISYNAIFLSAFKALLVFELLIESPKTLDELRNKISALPFIKSEISKDTLRVYMYTFENFGCKIERTLCKGARRKYNYFIPENPFMPNISNEQTQRFFEIYDMIMYNLPFESLFLIDLLAQKIDTCCSNEAFHSAYKNRSIMVNFDKDLIKELIRCCEENALVTVLYNSPRSGEKEISIIAHKMKIQNYKLYLEGFGMEYKQEAIFLVNRIIKITNVVPGESIELSDENFFDITFELYDSNIELLPCEQLISEKKGIRVVKHKTSNKVLSTHRFLQLEDSAKILAPEDYKAEFIAKLKSVKEVYLYGQ